MSERDQYILKCEKDLKDIDSENGKLKQDLNKHLEEVNFHKYNYG